MSHFRIAAAQIPSVRGDIAANIATHRDAVMAAVARDVSVLVFPELSLTGYEPDLGAALACSSDDSRLTSLRHLALQHRITLVVGAPIRVGTDKPAIGAFIFTPAGEINTYRKMHLGASETAYFSHGQTPVALDVQRERIGIAICADSSRPSHPGTYAEQGAGIYAAGVFLTDEWYITDTPRLQKYAADLSMLTLMANQGASTGTYQSVGKSAVWAPGGRLLAQAEGVENALIIATKGTTRWEADRCGI